MHTDYYDKEWSDEAAEEDWPPREIEEAAPGYMDIMNQFIVAALEAAKSEKSNFTCPVCGYTAYCTGKRKGLYSKCKRCGIEMV